MAHHGTHDHASGSHHGELGHIIPFRVYATVLVSLLILTIITVAASRIDLGGNMNIIVAMLIASVKAAVVALFFMHLKYENPLVWLYVAFPIFLVLLMIFGIFVDNPYRPYPRIYTPAEMLAESTGDKAPVAQSETAPAH